MIESLKIVWIKIPKKVPKFIAALIIGYAGQRAFDWYFFDQTFFSWQRVVPAIIWSGILLFVYLLYSFFYYSLKLISELRQGKQSLIQPCDTRKPLPYSKVVIGSFKDRVLTVDILAEVILQETAQPGVEVFLTRIDIGKPYCPICSRPLDTQHASWMADGVQIGYECHSCHTQRKGHEYDIFNDVQGQIRRRGLRPLAPRRQPGPQAADARARPDALRRRIAARRPARQLHRDAGRNDRQGTGLHRHRRWRRPRSGHLHRRRPAPPDRARRRPARAALPTT